MDGRRMAIVVGVLVAIGIMAFLSASSQHLTRTYVPAPSQQASNQPAGPSNVTYSFGQCHWVNASLPDARCTPGVADPRISQANIHQTICVSGYTETVRPPASVTNPMKLASMKAYGLTDSPSNYEYDHLIPLELGGAPKDVRNFWPESGFGTDNFKEKDKLENLLHERVCAGEISLSQAQQEIAQNWLAAVHKEGLS
ncbi:MAG: hypothetical protein ABI361_10340 [Nitrososphaera sp.]